LWVNPGPDAQYMVSNLAGVTRLGARVKRAGFRFLLDLHLSDMWPDPGQQRKPKEWADLPFPQLVTRVHDYSRDVVRHLSDNGARPDIVQVGNEIRNGLLFGSGLGGSGAQPGGGFWEADGKGAMRAACLLDAGLRGVREALPKAPPLTMLHVPDGQDTGFVRWWFAHLAGAGRTASPPVRLDTDLVGLSYYPAKPWNHRAGYEPWRLEHLTATMNFVAVTLHKPVMVVETSWPQRGTPETMSGTPQFAFSPDGGAAFYRALLRAVKAVPGGRGAGVLAWEPDTLNWDSPFDATGHALPAVRALGRP